MAKTAKRKKLTQREKEENVQIKKELQAAGCLRPDKPKLNRKKFAAEVLDEFTQMDALERQTYLLNAVYCMVGKGMKKVSPEQVGILKVLKIAVETAKYEKLLPEGTHKYNLGEYVDKVVLPIRNL